MESSQREIDRAQTFDRPIPGQSLTNSPDQKYPWETSPQFTNVTEAQLYLFAELTQKDRFVALTNALADKVPVDILTRTILFEGFSRGLWSIDLLMLLIEPLAVIIMALGERVGIDYIFQDGDQDEPDENNEEGNVKGLKKLQEVEKSLKETIKNTSLDKNTQMLATKIQEGLEKIPEPLIEAAQESIKSKSLLEKTDG
jgi:hypothetical protein